MPSADRRTVLASLGTLATGSLAGCSLLPSDAPAAGSLRFENDDDLPHEISLRVTDVGAEPGDEPGTVQGRVTVPPAQRRLTASATVGPGEQQTYGGVFTEAVWYAVEFTVDDREPEHDTGTTAFNPAPSGRDEGRFLSGTVFQSGEFSWQISSTTNAGSFDIGADN